MKPLSTRSTLLFCLLTFLLSATRVSAESGIETSRVEKSTETHSLGYSFDLGVAFKQTSLDVFNKGASDPEGVLTGDFIITYSLGFSTPSTYLFDSNVGVTLLMNYSAIKMDTQEVGSEDLDLGTSAKGFFAYITPVLFYNFGDKVPQAKDRFRTFKVGFGVGLGYLRAKGDLILTDRASQDRLDFDLNSTSVAFGLYLDYRYNRFFSRLTLAGPEISEGAFEYDLFDISWTFGSRFDL